MNSEYRTRNGGDGADTTDVRLRTPLQERHDELERMQAMLRNMPVGGRVGGSAPTHAPRVTPSAAKSNPSDNPSSKGHSRGGFGADVRRDVGGSSAPTHTNPTGHRFRARPVFDAIMRQHEDGDDRLEDEVCGYTVKTTAFGDDGNGDDFTSPFKGPRFGDGPPASSSHYPQDQTPQPHQRRSAPQPMPSSFGAQFAVHDERPARTDIGINAKQQAAPPQNTAATTTSSPSYLLNELRAQCPFLSAGFVCSADDAVVLLTALSAAKGQGGDAHMSGSGTFGRGMGSSASGGGVADAHGGSTSGNGYVGTLEDKVAGLEAEVKSLGTRLERRSEECDKLRDDVAEARQRARALEAGAKQQQTLLAQRREETRKQLLTEEGRTAKLQHHNKLLQQELDKLKMRLLK